MGPLMYRRTVWMDDRGSVLQVACAALDSETWDALAEAVELVGPFDDVGQAESVAASVATNLARRQLAGQLALEL